MTKLLMDGHVWRVDLEETDTLKDMAAVSGYTMERLAVKIENIIAESIIEEDERREEEYKGKEKEKEPSLVPEDCPGTPLGSAACKTCKTYWSCPLLEKGEERRNEYTKRMLRKSARRPGASRRPGAY